MAHFLQSASLQEYAHVYDCARSWRRERVNSLKYVLDEARRLHASWYADCAFRSLRRQGRANAKIVQEHAQVYKSIYCDFCVEPSQLRTDVVKMLHALCAEMTYACGNLDFHTPTSTIALTNTSTTNLIHTDCWSHCRLLVFTVQLVYTHITWTVHVRFMSISIVYHCIPLSRSAVPPKQMQLTFSDPYAPPK